MKKILILIAIMFLSACVKEQTVEPSNKPVLEYTVKVDKFIEKLELVKDWSTIHFSGHCWISTIINEVEVVIFDSSQILIDSESAPKVITSVQQERISKIYHKYGKCIKTDPLDKVLK